MSTVKQPVGTKSSVTCSGLSTLASAGYATSATITNTTNQPLDLLIEVAITPGTVSGNKQAVVYAQVSLDGTNWQTGATGVSDEINATPLGTVPLPTNSTLQRNFFSIVAAYMALYPYVRIVVKNDSGAAFTAGTIYSSEVNPTIS